MICLYCETTLPSAQPQICAECQVEHTSRPPVVGVNHVSQLLSAIDDVREGEMDLEEFEEVLAAFAEMLASFEERWQTRDAPLASQISAALADRFKTNLEGLDQALALGGQAMELLEGLEDPADVERLGHAEEALVGFFQGICSNAAAALEEFDKLTQQAQTSGALFNSPSM